jgi:hypothetical protein
MRTPYRHLMTRLMRMYWVATPEHKGTILKMCTRIRTTARQSHD